MANHGHQMSMPAIPFEYYALLFLIQWEEQERVLHEQTASKPSAEQIRSALTYFQVARSFPDLANKAQNIVYALNEVAANPRLCTEQKVTTLAIRLSRSFGQVTLAAASKLLWLKHRRPFIIYDSRTSRALRAINPKFKDTSYGDYYRFWRRRYRKHKEAITKAAGRLREVRTFLPRWHRTEDELVKLVSQPWFLERVFDKYLWIKGKGDSE